MAFGGRIPQLTSLWKKLWNPWIRIPNMRLFSAIYSRSIYLPWLVSGRKHKRFMSLLTARYGSMHGSN
jgi:hypothetical protein